MIRAVFVLLLATSWAGAQDLAGEFVQFAFGQNGTQDTDYEKGLRALDGRHWDEAVADFQMSAEHAGVRADASLYWKAYAQDHAGRLEEALATIAQLEKEYPSSRWIKDAQALAIEVRTQTGAPVNPGAQPDEDLKLLALNSLMQSSPDQALPILQKVLAGNDSVKVKERALFILAQSSSGQAARILSDEARNSSDPELQRIAIRYMGMMGNADTRKELVSVYKSSSDPRVKSDILKSFMQSGSRDFLLSVAKTEQDPKLRREAIRQLALTGGQEQLWQLYGSETSVEDKKEILKSMFLAGNADRLVEIARSEKDPELRVAAIKSLGLMGKRGQAEDDALVSIYRSDSNPEVRNAILNALFLQQNGKAMVGLARTEKDPHWKEEIVRKMALIHSPEVTNYMLEILK